MKVWDGEAFELQLQEDAERLLENLATGDGEHSEALDLGLIKAAFRHLLTWAPLAASLDEETPAQLYKCLDCAWYGPYAELIQAGLNHELCPKCEGVVFKIEPDAALVARTEGETS